MVKISVIILNFKTKDLTIRCIESVKKSDYKNIEIIVVDNNSEDGLSEALNKSKDVIFIPNDKNAGFSGGNNLGIKKALKSGADYIFILNPDTEVEKNTISNLISKMEAKDVDIASPKIYFHGSKKIWYGGGEIDQLNVLGSHGGMDQIDNGQYDQMNETDLATGAAMMIKKEVFEKIGLFDERYFLYYEDADFCFRAKKVGFKIMYIPEAVVYHENAQSTGLGSSLQDYYITRNRMLFAAKFLPFRTKFALFREALRNLNINARRKALFDFMIGNLGKGSI